MAVPRDVRSTSRSSPVLRSFQKIFALELVSPRLVAQEFNASCRPDLEMEGARTRHCPPPAAAAAEPMLAGAPTVATHAAAIASAAARMRVIGRCVVVVRRLTVDP